MSFPVGMVAQLTVRADVCDAVVSNESEVLEICVEGEGCVVCVSVHAHAREGFKDPQDLIYILIGSISPCYMTCVTLYSAYLHS